MAARSTGDPCRGWVSFVLEGLAPPVVFLGVSCPLPRVAEGRWLLCSERGDRSLRARRSLPILHPSLMCFWFHLTASRKKKIDLLVPARCIGLPCGSF